MKRAIYDDDHEAFRSSVKEFLDRDVVPHLEEHADNHGLPREFWTAAGKEGFLGPELAGAMSRARIYEGAPEGTEDTLAELSFNGGSVAGQGFGAFNAWGLVVRVEGGAQDGVGKAMLGGTVSIMKGRNRDGRRLNGSVGKSFAYGAQRGRL